MPRVWEQEDRCSELTLLRRRGRLAEAVCGQSRREGGNLRTAGAARLDSTETQKGERGSRLTGAPRQLSWPPQ